MKKATIPPVPASPDSRKQAEAVLAKAKQAKMTGKYVSADRVIQKLERKLIKAKQHLA